MRIEILVIIICMFSYSLSTKVHAQSIEKFSRISVVDSNTVYVAGSKGLLLKTVDGGTNWEKTPKNFGELINNMCFISPDTGFITTYHSSVLYKTLDGGSSWDSVIQFDLEIKDMKFLDSNIGFLAGVNDQRNISKTIDGGLHWNGYFSGSNQFVATRLSIANQNVIYSTSWCCDFAVSYDQGISWMTEYNSLPMFFLSIEKLLFINESTGFLIGSGVGLYGTGDYAIFSKTYNGGEDWDVVFFNQNTTITDIYFIDNSNGWIISDGYIYSTNDGFTSKDSINIPISKFGFYNESSAYGISGDKIYKTRDGWLSADPVYTLTTIKEDINMPVEGFSVVQNYPNPFNSTTKLKFSLDQTSKVTIKIYDVLGKEIEFLTNEYYMPGTYEIFWNAQSQPTGVYYFKISSGFKSRLSKAVLIK